MRIVVVLAATVAASGVLGEPLATGQVHGEATTLFGDPLEGVEVTLRGQGEGGLVRVTRTNKAGEYHLDNTPEGDYMLSARLAGFLTKEHTVAVVARVNQGTAEWNFDLAAIGRVRGRVTTLFGAPLEGVELTLTGPGDGSFAPVGQAGEEGGLVRRTHTDGAGEYHFEGIPEGNYSVGARSTGFVSRKQPVTVLRELDEGIAVSDFGLDVGELNAAPRRVIRGVVRGKNGKPVAGARIVVVVALDPSRTREERSDAHGKFRIATSLSGEAVVYAHYPGYHVDAHCVLLRTGEQRVDFLLQPAETIGESTAR
jgi:hypothetical protein